ncbi:MAG: hypothetical protein WC101_03860 [Candidatus Gracilibacteria bacterium]
MQTEVTEKIEISESVTATTRRSDEINFWFLVKFSLHQSNIYDDERRKAFLMNAVVMALNTLESFFNNISEFYLEPAAYQEIDKLQALKPRFEKAVRFLSGHEGDGVHGDVPGRMIGVKKVDIISIEDFFLTKQWQSILKLRDLRKKIMHRKTCDKIHFPEGGTPPNNQPSNKEPEVNLSESEKLILNLEEVFYTLQSIFKQSIVEYIPQRFDSFFSFLEINKDVGSD